MLNPTMLQQYGHIKTGQDLIDSNVVPKNSSEHLAIIAYERLKALEQRASQKVSADMLGEWVPLIAKTSERINGESDPETFWNQGEPGMTVYGQNAYGGRVGTISDYDSDSEKFRIQWEGESDAQFVKRKHLQLELPDTAQYKIVSTAVADENVGHYVRLTKDITGLYNGGRRQAELPQGLEGKFVGFDDNTIHVDFREPPLEGDDRTLYAIPYEDGASAVELSSLGQDFPKDGEEIVREDAYAKFFERTRLPIEVGHEVLVGVMLEKDQLFHGHTGSGKTQICQDLQKLAEVQQISFIVSGSEAQTSPFSLFDKEFSEEVIPEPLIASKYSQNGNYLESGIFLPPKPKDVPVTMVAYRMGHGIEKREGTISMKRYNYAGSKMPELRLPGDEDAGDANVSKMYDPSGFEMGLLQRTNNGLFIQDEADKLSPSAIDCLLQALESDTVSPEHIRYEYPAHAKILFTANQMRFSDPFNDRVSYHGFWQPTDPNVSYDITRMATYKLYNNYDEVEIPDTHTLPGLNLTNSVVIPTIVERALDRLYIQFREEYNDKGKNGVTASSRSKSEAIRAARANLKLDQIFFDNTPTFVTEDYAIRGIEFAMQTRVDEEEKNANVDARESLSTWVRDNFSRIQEDEVNSWWCNFFKETSRTNVVVPGLEDNLRTEIAQYQMDTGAVEESFESVRKDMWSDDPTSHRRAAVEKPFMFELVMNQMNMKSLQPEQAVDVVNFYLGTLEHSSCKLDD